MASLNEYIYDIRGIIRNHHNVDDDYLTNRQIEFWIMSQRAMWIKRRDRLFIQNDHSLIQSLTTEVISIDRSFEPINIPVGYRILRTEKELPKTINFESWDGIITCGPVDMAAKRFNHCEYQQAVNGGHGRFNKGQIFTFLMDQYLYLISRSVTNYWFLISQIAITGIFEDPRELAYFKHITGEECWSEDMEYPISLDLWDYMKSEIVKANIDALVKIPIDLSNDDNPQKVETP